MNDAVHDQRPGPHLPTVSSPPRRGDSLRRTLEMRISRPDGLTGDLILSGTGRDLYTAADGGSRTVAEASAKIRIDYMAGRIISEARSQPALDLGGLVGVRAGAGFRAALAEIAGTHLGDQSLIRALLDDVPVVTLISGHAIPAQTPVDADYWARRGRGRDLASTLRNVDVCEGWREGGTLVTQLRKIGAVPFPTGPAAPDIKADDPAGWHATAVMPPGDMRRIRRVDVWFDPEIRIDAMFRDSYRHTDGVESVIHEYTLRGSAGRQHRKVVQMEAEPRVLPWFECPTAAASASRLAGQSLSDLRNWVRSDLTGLGTCTHLNDALRGLADVEELSTRLSVLRT